MSIGSNRAALLAVAVVSVVGLMRIGHNPLNVAEAGNPKASENDRIVEKIDVGTGDTIALPLRKWTQLGSADGRYKNPKTGKYSMAPVATCRTCGEKIPAYVPDPAASLEEVLRGKSEYKCPKCKQLALVDAGLSAAEELEIWLERSQRSYGKLDNYTAVFYKRERVKGKLGLEERVEFKFKKPFQVYMKWVGTINKGQECLYAKGRYRNKLVARGSGRIRGLKVVHIDPEGKTAMSGIRHPITEAGIGHLIDLLKKDRRLAARHGEGQVINKGRKAPSRSKHSSMGRTQNFSCVLPKARRSEYYCHRAEIAFDVDSGLPVSIFIYDAAGKLLEHYRYEDLKLDPGLTGKDFDKDSKAYRL